ncbi:serine/threonine-protein phosphatase 2A activator-like [Condylostylus longicornis]|uniref:serine/threonine-protein phosphatase 2A activator-like n=1 Tax=Condylostylus longicornis TaxID=2530218 RepID=UPI00244DD5DF|nr:serine/threonine-protein phosphatase 2A activator-like [Condylostylus longicornis]
MENKNDGTNTVETASYVTPEKKVKSMADMNKWQKSEAYYDLIGFINGISVVIQGKRNSYDCYVSETMNKLLEIFDKLNKLVDDTPPIDQPQRFGNQAFRIWFEKLSSMTPNLLVDAIPEKYHSAITEFSVYFVDSFGNQTRIDYGTGHELNFIMLLCSFFKVGVLQEKDNIAVALKLFNSYLTFVRRLQKTYRMEPAGSQGVWSLDDYQFVPFIWGSAQLSINSPFDPSKFLDADVINNYKNEYIYIGCIDYICQVKTGHFAEHSNQLWSISAVPSWSKISSGLVKMYQKEILAKFPVIQHVFFGTIMSFNTVKPGTTLYIARLGVPESNSSKLPTMLSSAVSESSTK